MRAYLAARYGRRAELLGYRQDLTVHGIAVTSRWLDGGHSLGGHDEGDRGAPPPEASRWAGDDLVDIASADVVISFTEPSRSGPSRGGRHVEFGIGYALGKRSLVVGPFENVFHRLPLVERHETWDGALGALTARVTA